MPITPNKNKNKKGNSQCFLFFTHKNHQTIHEKGVHRIYRPDLEKESTT